jgi:cell division protein FtsL
MTAAWWRGTAWPWIKENWWAVLLLPAALVVAIVMVVWRFTRRPLVLDPLGEADARAALEAERRTQQLEEQRVQLEQQVAALEERYVEQQAVLERGIEEEVEALRNDPQRLRELMLRSGPGSK